MVEGSIGLLSEHVQSTGTPRIHRWQPDEAGAVVLPGRDRGQPRRSAPSLMLDGATRVATEYVDRVRCSRDGDRCATECSAVRGPLPGRTVETILVERAIGRARKDVQPVGCHG